MDYDNEAYPIEPILLNYIFFRNVIIQNKNKKNKMSVNKIIQQKKNNIFINTELDQVGVFEFVSQTEQKTFFQFC